jgi:small multidrug resistance family-3 protein
MTNISTLLLFAITAFFEILGCYSVYSWLKLGKSAYYLILASVSLALFAWFLTFHPSSTGRVYAAYGGVYVAMSVLWLWLGEKQFPDRWDLIGTIVTLIGMGIIAFSNHKN